MSEKANEGVEEEAKKQEVLRLREVTIPPLEQEVQTLRQEVKQKERALQAQEDHASDDGDDGDSDVARLDGSAAEGMICLQIFNQTLHADARATASRNRIMNFENL